MDSLLKEVNLDCKFMAYGCLACSSEDGMIEFIKDSNTIQNIIAQNSKNVSNFLKKQTNDPAEYDQIVDNYISSCAGYAAVTYLMGVGDRHLENLMLNNKG